MIVDIVPEKRTGADKDFYSYRVPENLTDKIKVGSLVLVPFGKKNIRGVVVGLAGVSNPDFELKEISSIAEGFTLPEPYVKVAKDIADYYLCSYGEAISLFLPPEMSRPKKPIKDDSPEIKNDLKTLTEPQKEVIARLMVKLDGEKNKPALLFGITSSGKTEVYLRLAQEVISRGKQVVVLVPEIVLTPQTIERFEEHFQGNVAVMNSGLSKSEKYHNFYDFYSGRKSVIVGPRSALLVPSQNLGLIIVDEEGESAYKQEKNPKYHAVKVAEDLARETNALLLLGSATPTLESYFQTKRGRYELLELKTRHHGRDLPKATVVDLREEIKKKNYSPISEQLQAEISETLKNGRQTFLFLNRRGTATFVSCRECGEVIMCPNCSIPLVYHLNFSPPAGGGVRGGGRGEAGYLACHHCDYQTTVPLKCPACQGYKIKHFGTGIEKIERTIAELFPTARIRRVDSSTLSTKGAYAELYNQLKNREIDILIGTQIIAKGLDIPSVDLVGVVSADVGLYLPYYRADEKTFQILTQVSGRSGRGENLGKTIIQTYWPEAKALKAAQTHDFELFFDLEIKDRQEFNFPPFCHLVRVIAEDEKQEKAKSAIEAVAKEAKKRGLEIIGPAKAFLSRLRGKHRYHLIFKVKSLPDANLTEVFKTNPYLFWDVDPEDLL